MFTYLWRLVLICGPFPVVLRELLLDTAVRMEYPHLMKVAGVCKEIINGVDQGLDWGKYEHTASANNPSVTSAEWEPSMVILPLEEIDGRQLRLIPG